MFRNNVTLIKDRGSYCQKGPRAVEGPTPDRIRPHRSTQILGQQSHSEVRSLQIRIKVRYLARHSKVYSIYRGEEEAEREKRGRQRRDGEAEGDVSLEWAEENGAQRARRRWWWWRGGCDAFTEGALSGWRSPPLPRLSAQTQTAPEEEEEEEGGKAGRGGREVGKF